MPGDGVALVVREVLAHALHRNIEDIELDASLEKHLGMDSLATIDVSIELEARLDVTFPDFAAPHELGLNTVQDLVRLAQQRVDAHERERRR